MVCVWGGGGGGGGGGGFRYSLSIYYSEILVSSQDHNCLLILLSSELWIHLHSEKGKCIEKCEIKLRKAV